MTLSVDDWTGDVDSDSDGMILLRGRKQQWTSSYLSDDSSRKRDGEEDGGTHDWYYGSDGLVLDVYRARERLLDAGWSV